MPDHERIYEHESETYDLLISRQAGLLEVIEKIRPVAGLDIVDMGAGSGRLTRELAPKAKSIIALDKSPSMLQLNSDTLQKRGWHHAKVLVADHRSLPLEDNSADLIVSGWSIAYLCNSQVVEWETNLRQIMQEIHRVLRPGGTVILFENYGTGSSEPNPPSYLTGYFEQLERVYRFSHQWIRTDYIFADLAEAERLIRFFFGDHLARQAVEQQSLRFPECAGVWWLHMK